MCLKKKLTFFPLLYAVTTTTYTEYICVYTGLLNVQTTFFALTDEGEKKASEKKLFLSTFLIPSKYRVTRIKRLNRTELSGQPGFLSCTARSA